MERKLGVDGNFGRKGEKHGKKINEMSEKEKNRCKNR
jgi:hypothetical protein